MSFDHDGDPRQRVRDDSDSLLEALDKMKSMEQEKRQEDISSPPFHRLAEDVEGQARKVFDIAANETRDGDRAPSGDVSVNQVPPSTEQRAASDPRHGRREEREVVAESAAGHRSDTGG